MAGCVPQPLPAGAAPPSADLAIVDVDVFDSRTKEVIEGQTILIQADRIVAVIGADRPFVATETIQGEGRLAVPGFVETHAHTQLMLMEPAGDESSDAPGETPPVASDRQVLADQYLRYGTTTVIDMAQPEDWLSTTLDWQNDPRPEYPNYHVSGSSFISATDRPLPPHWVSVAGPEAARAKVREYAALGIKRLKLYRLLNVPEMRAAVEEADRLGLQYAAHTDNNVVTIQEAMEVGVTDFEHFFTVIPSTLDMWTEADTLFQEHGIDGIGHIDEFAATLVLFFEYIDRTPRHRERLGDLFGGMADRGASMSTALNVLASAAGRSSYFCSFEPLPSRSEPTLSYPDLLVQTLGQNFDAVLRAVRAAHDAGVMLRIGTDCREGGQALMAEMLLLEEAGIPMADVLQIATWNGAVSMRLDESVGSIEVGKQADIVLFESDPFESARHLLSDKTIIKGGREFSPREL